MGSLGQALREEREARNISIEEIASSTKIVARYLEAIEADHLDRMPGGFFVRGIIRSYAKAIGLDPDAVLNRYKEAGLLEPAEPDKRVFPRPAPKPAPKAEPSATSATTRPSATTRSAGPTELAGPAELTRPAESATPAESAPEAGPPAEPEEADGPKTATHTVQFTEAPGPGLTNGTRKRILAWTWRIIAAAVVVAVVLVIWPRGPGQPGKAPAGAPARAAEVKTDQPPATQNEPATDPAAVPAAVTAPAAEAVREGLTIEIAFQAETWIEVLADGAVMVSGLFPPGSTARARADGQLLIHTGNAGGFTFRLNGRPAKPLGRVGQLLRDVKITLENLPEFLESPSSGAPTG